MFCGGVSGAKLSWRSSSERMAELPRLTSELSSDISITSSPAKGRGMPSVVRTSIMLTYTFTTSNTDPDGQSLDNSLSGARYRSREGVRSTAHARGDGENDVGNQ
jgi:hypothetical protein